MQLAVSHIDRDDSSRACLKQAVGEAAGGRPDIRAVAPGDDDLKRSECVLEFLPTSRHEARRVLDAKLHVLVDLLAGFGMPRDEPGEHERLRLASALGQPTLDEQGVHASLHTVEGSRSAAPASARPAALSTTPPEAPVFIVLSRFHRPFTRPRVDR